MIEKNLDTLKSLCKSSSEGVAPERSRVQAKEGAREEEVLKEWEACGLKTRKREALRTMQGVDYWKVTASLSGYLWKS